jgi:hypothetical protein
MNILLTVGFGMKIEISLTYFYYMSKSRCDLKLHFEYVVREAMCRLCTKIGTNLLSKSFNLIYFLFIMNLL